MVLHVFPILIPPPTSLNRAYHKADVLVLTESNLTFFFPQIMFLYLKVIVVSKVASIFFCVFHQKCYQMPIFCAQCTLRPNNTEMLKFGAGKISLKSHTRRSVAYTCPLPPPTSTPSLPQKSPQFLKGFQQSTFKGKVTKGHGQLLQTSYLGFLCSCICPCRSGHDIPINLQQDKCCSLFCKFLSLYEWTLGGLTPEIRLPVYFMLQAMCFYKTCSVSMIKYRKRNRFNMKPDLLLSTTEVQSLVS